MYRKFVLRIALFVLVLALPAAAKETVKLAFIGPLTGGNSALGLGGRNSADLAVKLHNASGKGKYQYELVVLDDECKPDTGVQALEILLSWAVTTLLLFLVVLTDERRMSEERLENAWPVASRDLFLVWLGILALPFHFARTRGRSIPPPSLDGIDASLAPLLARCLDLDPAKRPPATDFSGA